MTWPLTPWEEWVAGQPARDAREELHREAMKNPDYAAAHRAAIDAKVKAHGPSSGRQRKRQEFETPLKPIK